MESKEYAILLQKGLAMFDETISLFNIWQPGMSSTELSKLALSTGVLSRSTEYRVKDIITRVFFWRYFIDEENPAKYLKQLNENHYSHDEFVDILKLYICRTNQALYDFIIEIYWPKFIAGNEYLTKDDSIIFLKEAMMRGYMKKTWSDPQIIRIASNMLGILEEFRMLNKTIEGKRKIIAKVFTDNFLLYLSHELHFSNISDIGMVEHADWQLLGMKKNDVIRNLERISYRGFFIFQNAGDLIRITWKYKSMEEFIDAISQ
jgi:hypothetical protein